MKDATKLLSTLFIIGGVLACKRKSIENFIVHNFSESKIICPEEKEYTRQQNSKENLEKKDDCSNEAEQDKSLEDKNVSDTLLCPEPNPDCRVNMGNPKYLYHPTTVKEVQQLLYIQQFGKTVKISGGYTFKELSYTKDVIIRTINMNKILSTSVDNQTVRVESGMLLKDLYKHLEDNGLALSVIPPVGWKSVGSAVSIGSHGSNISMGSFCSQVKQVTVILSNGSVRTYCKKHPEFKAVLCGIGGSVFIYSVTLNCVPAYNVSETVEEQPWENVCAGLDTYLSEHTLTQFTIDPYSENLNCTLKLRKPVSNSNISTLVNTFENDAVDTSYKVLSGEVNKPSAEYTINYKHYSLAIADILSVVRTYADVHDERVKDLCVRFTGKDKYSYLSRAKHERNCHIEIVGACNDMLKEIEDSIIVKYKGCPAYEKTNFLHEQKMVALFGHNFRDYQSQRNSLDSERVFTNKHLRERIGV